MILGLCGLARCGKDSFFEYCKEYFENKKINCKRFAFADELKKELDAFLVDNFEISAFAESEKEKEIIRPLLVAYGCAKRDISNGSYWIEKIKNDVKNNSQDGSVSIVTDVRFENEIDWINSVGSSIHISRSGNEPPNEEEKENDPKVKAKSEHKICWIDFDEFPCKDAKYVAFSFLDRL